MAGGRGRTYELMVEIAGRVSRNFNGAIQNAQRQLGGFSDTLKRVGIAVSTAAIATAGISFFEGSIEEAIEYESVMADVVKVVDGLRDENGRLTQSYYEMSDGILEMSKRIPMTTSEIGEIVAAAGQAGIASEDLTKFAEDSAKMGIAFDTTAEQAGEWMAAWRTSFGMSQSEVVALADQINYLSNTTSENTQKLSGVVSRIGSLGQVAGLSGEDIAAMAASMTNISEEISATGIKNLMLTMTAGEAATDKQAAVLKKLGFSATEMAERMQTDAKGAILDFLGAVQALPEAERTATLTQYFGRESVAAIAPLLSNLAFLEEQFQKVGDASLYAGSMEAEYAARADTTANKIQLAKNQISALQIEIGQRFLPIVGDAAEKFSELIDDLPEFVSEHQTAITVVGGFAAAIAGIKLAAFIVTLGKATVALTMNRIAMAKSGAETLILKGMYAKDAIARGISTAATVAHTAAQTAQNIVMGAGAVAANALGAAFRFMTGPIGIAITIIGALIAAGVLLYKNWDTVKAKAAELWAKVKETFGGIREAISGAFEAGKAKVAEFFSWIGDKLHWLDEKVSSIPLLGSVYSGIKGGIGWVGSKLMEHPVAAMANGGVVTAPTLSLIGEGGEPEAVLPLSRLEKMLDGISTGGGGITYSPRIVINGNTNRDEVISATRASYDDFKRLMNRYLKDNRRVAL